MLRAENKALFGSLHSRQAECIGSLIRLAAISSGVFPNDVVKKRCIRILSGGWCGGGGDVNSMVCGEKSMVCGGDSMVCGGGGEGGKEEKGLSLW